MTKRFWTRFYYLSSSSVDNQVEMDIDEAVTQIEMEIEEAVDKQVIEMDTEEAVDNQVKVPSDISPPDSFTTTRVNIVIQPLNVQFSSLKTGQRFHPNGNAGSLNKSTLFCNCKIASLDSLNTR